MATRFGDLLEESVDYTDGSLRLMGPLPGRRSFRDVMNDGDTAYVRLESIGVPTEWMLVKATFYASDPPEIGVQEILASSADGGYVDFPAGATAACVQPSVSVVAVSGDGSAPSASDDPDSVAAGIAAVAEGAGSTAFGARAAATAQGAVAIGCDAQATTGDGVAVGRGARAAGSWNAVAVGGSAEAGYYGSVALGFGARAWGEHVTAVGPAAFTWAKSATFVRDGGSLVILPPNMALSGDLHVIMYNESGDVWSGKASVCVYRDGDGPLAFAGGSAPPLRLSRARRVPALPPRCSQPRRGGTPALFM